MSFWCGTWHIYCCEEIAASDLITKTTLKLLVFKDSNPNFLFSILNFQTFCDSPLKPKTSVCFPQEFSQKFGKLKRFYFLYNSSQEHLSRAGYSGVIKTWNRVPVSKKQPRFRAVEHWQWLVGLSLLMLVVPRILWLGLWTREKKRPDAAQIILQHAWPCQVRTAASPSLVTLGWKQSLFLLMPQTPSTFPDFLNSFPTCSNSSVLQVVPQEEQCPHLCGCDHN